MEEVLVRWNGLSESKTSWEDKKKMMVLYPSLFCEGNNVQEVVGDDRVQPSSLVILEEVRTHLVETEGAEQQANGGVEDEEVVILIQGKPLKIGRISKCT